MIAVQPYRCGKCRAVLGEVTQERTGSKLVFVLPALKALGVLPYCVTLVCAKCGHAQVWYTSAEVRRLIDEFRRIVQSA